MKQFIVLCACVLSFAVHADGTEVRAKVTVEGKNAVALFEHMKDVQALNVEYKDGSWWNERRGKDLWCAKPISGTTKPATCNIVVDQSGKVTDRK